MPCRAHAEDFTHRSDLAARRQSAGHRGMDADEVDKALGYERCPFVRTAEQLTHRELRGALLPDHAEVGDVLRRQRVFEEEQVELLYFFCEAHGLNRGHALVDVVRQLHLLTQL